MAQELAPAKAAWFRKVKATANPATDHGVKYIDSPRHKLEVQHYRYRTAIKKLLKKFGPVTAMPYPAHAQSSAMETERARGAKRPLQPAE